MRHEARRWPWLFALLLGAMPWATAVGAPPLTAREQAGRRLYFQGESSSGTELTATVGAGVRLPGSALPCANCHGRDGRGRAEGGVTPPPLIWSELTKPYGHQHPAGREHPVLDERSVARIISEGIDTGGNRLDPLMPRYAMSSEDMTNLLTWLKRLETEQAPGVTNSALRLGVVLPTRGQFGALGQAMRGLLEAYFEEINASGGIHGRRLELVVAEYNSDPKAGLASLRRLLQREPVFALLSGFLPGAEEEWVRLAEQEALPLIGPLTLSARKRGTSHAHVFFLFSDPGEQARVLADHAAQRLPMASPEVAILYPEDEALAEAARAAQARFQARGWRQVELLQYTRDRFPAALSKALRRKPPELVLFLGDGAELNALFGKARTLGWAPYLLLPGSLSGQVTASAPPSFQNRIFLTVHSLPGDEQPLAREAFARLCARVPSAERFRMEQISAYTAATVLTEALRRSGRLLSRDKLIEQWEGLYAFKPRLVPPLSYGSTGGWEPRASLSSQ